MMSRVQFRTCGVRLPLIQRITKKKTLVVVFANPSAVYSNRSFKEYVDNEEENFSCNLFKFFHSVR